MRGLLQGGQDSTRLIVTDENVDELPSIVANLIDGQVLKLQVKKVRLEEPLVVNSSVTIVGNIQESTPLITCRSEKSSAMEISYCGRMFALHQKLYSNFVMFCDQKHQERFMRERQILLGIAP